MSGAVVLFHDITELKQLDQIRREFVANVSHELRTPLSILRGYIEVLLDEPETSREELTRILSIMERHSKRLRRLVDDLLSLAQLESSQAKLELSLVRVDELFNNLIRDWKEKLAAKESESDCRFTAGDVDASRRWNALGGSAPQSAGQRGEIFARERTDSSSSDASRF